MAHTGEKDAVLSRKYGQLLRMQERLMIDLERARGELESPLTGQLLRDVQRSGSRIGANLSQATAAVEEALRAVQVCQSEIRRELTTSSDEFTLDGISNLPPTLAHFLAERVDLPGFHYEVLQDSIRGWIIRWKEYGDKGAVRGHGQFYERPYAWLNE